MAFAKPVSSLAAALAQFPNNISKVRDAGHPVHNKSLQSKHRGGLPTPPNSLSPNLPPLTRRSPSVPVSLLQPIESDFELHQQSSDGSVPLSSAALCGFEAAGAITAALLAKHHLPDILLKEGPLAIRVVLALLTQKVPGFSGIPPAKARRLVVSALESRSGGGLNGEVIFEKVGWGRWEARYSHQPSRDCDEGSPLGPGCAHCSPTSAPINPITSSNGTRQRTIQLRRPRFLGSPLLSPFEDDDHISEDEADKMSLDGEEPRPRSRPIPIIEPPLDDDEVTDEEDWEMMGYHGMVAASYEPSSCGSRRGSRMSAPSFKSSTPIHTLPIKHRTPSIDVIRSMSYSAGIMPFQRVYSSSLSSALRAQGLQASGAPQEPPPPACGSHQEREAIQALLKMGAM
jgi:hypothetical protein